MTKRIIFGIESYELTAAEVALFKEHTPLGIILFQRNCRTFDQIKKLVSQIKEVFKNTQPLILIDQEGGRVNRLRAFTHSPAAGYFVRLADKHNLDVAKEAVYTNYSNIARLLKQLGINVNCAPVADLSHKITHKVIGDRSFGNNPETVIPFCREIKKAFDDINIQSVIKHIPGHGRSTVDSHFNLPLVAADLRVLENSDFKVFKELSDFNFAMTAHIIYEALDPSRPITTSKIGIEYIRKNLGFKGVLMSDDITMKALNGDMQDIAHNVLNAGCDIVLHCSGNIEEMSILAQSVPHANDKLLNSISGYLK